MPWTPTIEIAGREVFASGVLVSNGNEPIQITPVPGPPNPYRLLFTFTDEPGSPAKYTTETVGPVVHLTLTNFGEGGFPHGTANLVNVGSAGNSDLVLAFACQAIGSGPSLTRILTYSITGRKRP